MTLADLINQVIDEDNTSISTIARKSGLCRSTVNSWAKGTRATTDRTRLGSLARGLERPEAAVFAAAGLTLMDGPKPDLAEITIVELYRQLPLHDRHVAVQILRALATRAAAQNT